LKRIDELAEIEFGKPRKEPGSARVRRPGGDGCNCGKRALVVALLRVDIPQRKPRAVEAGLQLQRRVEIAGCRLRRFREQSLDEVLEHGHGWTLTLKVVRWHRRRRRNPPGDALEGRKQFRQRTTLGHICRNPSRVEGDRPRMGNEIVVLKMQRTDHNLRGANELADANDGGIGKRRGRRDLQTFERLLSLFTRDRAAAERVQIVGQDHRSGLTQPEDAGVARHIVERHDEDARLRLRHGAERQHRDDKLT
jgi:hypothetical protein